MVAYDPVEVVPEFRNWNAALLCRWASKRACQRTQIEQKRTGGIKVVGEVQLLYVVAIVKLVDLIVSNLPDVADDITITTALIRTGDRIRR